MTMNIAETPLGELVAENINRARVFEKFGLDYCCGGKKTLGASCDEKGLDTQEVINALNTSDAEKIADKTDWRNTTMTELVDHILATHHNYLNSELPRLTDLIAKVVNAHSDHHPELVTVAEVFGSLNNELLSHMGKEEEILFPIIKQMESDGTTEFHCGSVENPINVMEMEHANAGDALSRLRSLNNDYQAPEDACISYQALMKALSELEFDMHQHIHKESSILFPRAIAKEKELTKN